MISPSIMETLVSSGYRWVGHGMFASERDGLQLFVQKQRNAWCTGHACNGHVHVLAVLSEQHEMTQENLFMLACAEDGLFVEFMLQSGMGAIKGNKFVVLPLNG